MIGLTSPAELGTALRDARRAQGLRLEDVALAAGVGIRFLSELERGKTTVRLAEVWRVLEALGVKLYLEEPSE